MPKGHAVVDGSNIATEGRSEPSLQQLDEAVTQFIAEHDFERVTVIVDASFEHRVAKSERKAARQAIDPDVAVMVDVSARYDTAGAIDLVRRLDGAGLTWIEEPVYPQRDHAALAEVAATGTTPLAAGENELSSAGLAALAASGAVGTLQPEVAKMGGLTETRAVGAIARDAGCGVAPHNFSMGPSWLASWHLAAHVAETTWLEVPWLPEGQTFPGRTPMPVVENGTVAAPTAPGLG